MARLPSAQKRQWTYSLKPENPLFVAANLCQRPVIKACPLVTSCSQGQEIARPALTLKWRPPRSQRIATSLALVIRRPHQTERPLGVGGLASPFSKKSEKWGTQGIAVVRKKSKAKSTSKAADWSVRSTRFAGSWRWLTLLRAESRQLRASTRPETSP